MNWSEVKPALRFLGIFLGVYLVLNLIYGLWIESLGTAPDSVTRSVSSQVAAILQNANYPAGIRDNPAGPTIFLLRDEQIILNVFEGCNGINVMIVFLSFVLAFGGKKSSLMWFVPVGFLVIHFSNLARIFGLYWLSEQNDQLFYYYHKYFFTALIYLIVFILWWIWVTRLSQYAAKPSKT